MKKVINKIKNKINEDDSMRKYKYILYLSCSNEIRTKISDDNGLKIFHCFELSLNNKYYK